MQAGDRVGSYEIVAPIGEGGFAQVYRVKHAALGSTHALKVLRPELLDMLEVRQRFLDEARVQAQLRHPNIVQVTDLIAEPGVAGFIMEFVEGESLAEVIARRSGMADAPTGEEVREVFLPVLEAVGFAHTAGVIHRDLKPDNVLLARDHLGRLVPKVTDFGIAKVVGELRGKRKSTLGARTMGTMGYTSPEQLVSSRDVDARSDIFSLGVALLEFATLESPFERDSDFLTMKAVHEADYEVPAALRRRDPVLVGAIERALKVEREARYPDCAAMASGLTALPSPPRRPAPPAVVGPPPRTAPPATRSGTPPARPKAEIPPLLVRIRGGDRVWENAFTSVVTIGSGAADTVRLDADGVKTGHVLLRPAGGSWRLEARKGGVTYAGSPVMKGGSAILARRQEVLELGAGIVTLDVMRPGFDGPPRPRRPPPSQRGSTPPTPTQPVVPARVQVVPRVDGSALSLDDEAALVRGVWGLVVGGCVGAAWGGPTGGMLGAVAGALIGKRLSGRAAIAFLLVGGALTAFAVLRWVI